MFLLAGPAAGQRHPEPPLLENTTAKQDDTFIAAYRAMGHPRFLIQTIIAGPRGRHGYADQTCTRLDTGAELQKLLHHEQEKQLVKSRNL